MKKFLLGIILLFTLLPLSVFAYCEKDGVTVVYINGIFTTKVEADNDLTILQKSYQARFGKDVKFLSGYNASHLGGLGDLIKSTEQAYGVAGLDTDLINILINLHEELSTRKVLLVGHSQGTFYTNLAYNYLVNHGVPKESIGVYNIATPDYYVAGDGGYVTSSTDKVINSIVRDLTTKGAAHKPLPANIEIPLAPQEEKSEFGGHGLSDVYLANAGDRILQEMHDQIDKLQSSDDAMRCFKNPNLSFWDFSSGLHLAVADGIVNVFKTGFSAVSRQLAFIWTNYRKFAVAGIPLEPGSSESAIIGDAFTDTATENIPYDFSKNFNAKQDEIDDFLEKLDSAMHQKKEVALVDEKNDVLDSTVKTPAKATLANVTTRGSRTNFPTILISEVQAAGVNDTKEEFVELYNPNATEIDLTNWYLQRKTKTTSDFTTYAPSSVFVGKKILAHNFFLIARQGYFAGQADVYIDNPLTDDNALALKSPNGEIIDKVGFGGAPDFENLPAMNVPAGKTIARTAEELDTQNNFSDFYLSVPTPRAVNVRFVPPPPVNLKNILINEVLIDSKVGVGGTDDDWVELYNPNDIDVSLKGWSLQKHSKDSPCSLVKSFYHKNFDDSAIIPARGFFLIVGTKASDALKLLANMTAGFSLSDDNTIYLVKSQDVLITGSETTISDKVGFGANACFAETAPAPSPEESKSIVRKILGGDTDNNGQDFVITSETTPGENFLKTILTDTTDYSQNPGVGPQTPPGYNLSLSWKSGAENITGYDVEYKLGDDDWQPWLSETTTTQGYFLADYSLLSDKIYSFRARAQNADGSKGNWSKEVVVDLSVPVIINEVAFAGTDGGAGDQWLELYNKSNQDIDLAGYKIISGSGFGENAKDSLALNLKGTILAKGYFILEKNDENTLPDVLADQLFFNDFGKNYLYLRAPNNRYLDELFVSSYGLSEGSFMQNGHRVSMERISEASLGQLDKNWHLALAGALGGSDRLGAPVMGTPAGKNTVAGRYAYYNFGFNSNVTLPKEFSPYLFAGPDVKIASQKTLTMEPGTVVKFFDKQSKLEVNGRLLAQGTADAPIVFTSYRDDEFGGDSNFDGAGTVPAPGDWLGVYFSSQSHDSYLENVNVRYGGAVLGTQPLTWGNAIWADNTSLTIKNSLIENNRNRAVKLSGGSSVLDTVVFRNNNTTDWPEPSNAMGIFIEGGEPVISNLEFYGGYTGILMMNGYDAQTQTTIYAKPTLTNNFFKNNVYPAILDTAESLAMNGNKAEGNLFDGVLLPQYFYRDITLPADLPYLAKNIVKVTEGKTLTLLPGSTILFLDNRSGMQIDGTLVAEGLPEKPISFKSYSASALPGSWLGLYFSKTSQNSSLAWANVSLAGSRWDNNYFAGIKVEESAIALKNSVIDSNANKGLWLINSPSVIDGVEFLVHKTADVDSNARALLVQGGAPEVKNSWFRHNYYGIYIEDWQNSQTGDLVPGAPVMDNNQFEDNVVDRYPLAKP